MIFHRIRIIERGQAVFPWNILLVLFPFAFEIQFEELLEIRRHPVVLGWLFFFLQRFEQSIEFVIRDTSPRVRIGIRLFSLSDQVLIIEFEEEQIDQLLIGFRQYAVQFLPEVTDGIGQFTIVERDIGESCNQAIILTHIRTAFLPTRDEGIL